MIYLADTVTLYNVFISVSISFVLHAHLTCCCSKVAFTEGMKLLHGRLQYISVVAITGVL